MPCYVALPYEPHASRTIQQQSVAQEYKLPSSIRLLSQSWLKQGKPASLKLKERTSVKHWDTKGYNEQNDDGAEEDEHEYEYDDDDERRWYEEHGDEEDEDEEKDADNN